MFKMHEIDGNKRRELLESILDKLSMQKLKDFLQKRDIFVFSKKKNQVTERILQFSLSLDDMKELTSMADIKMKDLERCKMETCLKKIDAPILTELARQKKLLLKKQRGKRSVSSVRTIAEHLMALGMTVDDVKTEIDRVSMEVDPSYGLLHTLKKIGKIGWHDLIEFMRERGIEFVGGSKKQIVRRIIKLDLDEDMIERMQSLAHQVIEDACRVCGNNISKTRVQDVKGLDVVTCNETCHQKYVKTPYTVRIKKYPRRSP